jgi:oxygen-dependent protoporphyrinogen oxidase
MHEKKIALIGAGISGLSLAFWLRKRKFNIRIFEQSDRVGGSIITEKEDGFLMDMGPNSILETSPVIKKLVADTGLENQKCYASEISNNRYILRDGRLHALPMSPIKFIKTRLFSGSAKLRLLREPFLKATTNPEITLADFVRYRLGNEFLDYAINPFVAGVYAGDPEALSTAAAFPKLYALEQKYGSLIKGQIKGAKERKQRGEVAKDRARMFSFIGGLNILTETLAEAVEGSLILHHKVDKILFNENGYRLRFDSGAESDLFDAVVVTTPTPTIAQMIPDLRSEQIELLMRVVYAPVVVIYMGFKQEDVQRTLDGFGFLVPKIEKRQILGSIWSSSLFPGRAPEGFAAFTTFVGGMRQIELVQKSETELQEMVIEELSRIVGITGKPVMVRLRKWQQAIPQYTQKYSSVQALFDQLEDQHPGLFFSGNFRRGISVGDCIVGADKTAKDVCGYFDGENR